MQTGTLVYNNDNDVFLRALPPRKSSGVWSSFVHVVGYSVQKPLTVQIGHSKTISQYVR